MADAGAKIVQHNITILVHHFGVVGVDYSVSIDTSSLDIQALVLNPPDHVPLSFVVWVRPWVPRDTGLLQGPSGFFTDPKFLQTSYALPNLGPLVVNWLPISFSGKACLPIVHVKL